MGTDKGLDTAPVEVPAIAAARSAHGPTHAPARGTRVGPRAGADEGDAPRSSRPGQSRAPVERRRTARASPVSARRAEHASGCRADSRRRASACRTRAARRRVGSGRAGGTRRRATMARPSGRRANLHRWPPSPAPELRDRMAREKAQERAERAAPAPMPASRPPAPSAMRIVPSAHVVGRLTVKDRQAARPRAGGALESGRGGGDRSPHRGGRRHGRSRDPAGRLSRVRPGSRPHRLVAARDRAGRASGPRSDHAPHRAVASPVALARLRARNSRATVPDCGTPALSRRGPGRGRGDWYWSGR